MIDTETAIEITQRQIDELKSNLSTLVTQEYYDSFNLAVEVKQKAIQALQEKAERDKGCTYCNEKTCENCGQGNQSYCDNCKHQKSWCDREVSFKYWVPLNKFCPMCGRKLNNAPTDEL